MTFTRSHHQVIAAALGCLNAPVLRSFGCLFAGGTALALRFGEYRESVDIDFVVSDADAYRDLREACQQGGAEALMLSGQRVVTAEPFRVDQYGIRTALDVTGVKIKFEIIREGRISLDAPTPEDEVLGLATPTLTDLVAMKMLANSDRWSDPTVFSRDIIDLAMAMPTKQILIGALDKAVGAYGEGVVRDSQSAIARLIERDDVLSRCIKAMAMEQPRAVLVDRLRRLSAAIQAAHPVP